MWSRNKINSVLATIYFISAPSVCGTHADEYAQYRYSCTCRYVCATLWRHISGRIHMHLSMRN